MKRKQWLFTLATMLVAVTLVYLLNNVLTTARSKEVSYSDFLSEVRAGHLAEVQITEKKLIGTLKEEKTGKAPVSRILTATRLPGMGESELLKDLEAQGVKFSGQIQNGSGWLYALASWVLPLLFLAWIYRLGMQRMGQAGGPLTFGKTRAKVYDESTRTEVTFEDVAGVDEAKAELVEVVDFLKHPKKYQSLGGRIPKGVLLVGPPGTGKTLLAKAVAGEAGVSFFSISGSGFVEMFVGVGAARVRDLFEQAKGRAPCIIFIDELDAIGRSRSAGGVLLSNEERQQTLNQLMVEMDGFDTSEGVIIMAATNSPEVLDPALLRGGRFDRQVIVNRPDLAGREAILQVHARKLKLHPSVDLKTIAARTPGMVGADLATIVNEAALLAVRRAADAVGMRDFEEAIDRVMLGLEQKKRVMTPEEKERVAYHESGHALVALSVEHADPVHRVSIIPRAIGAVGYILQLPLQEKYLMTKPEIEDRLAVMLGGRAAEDIIYDGVISTGASNDLERASELVRQAVTRFGMSEQLGPLTWGLPTQMQFLPTPYGAEQRNFSEHTAQMIDKELRHIIDEVYARAKAILTRRRAELERIADELVRKETLSRDELDRLLSPSQLAEVAPEGRGRVAS